MEKFWPSKEIALIGPAVTVALKEQGLFFPLGTLFNCCWDSYQEHTFPRGGELSHDRRLAVPALQSWHVQNGKILMANWKVFLSFLG